MSYSGWLAASWCNLASEGGKRSKIQVFIRIQKRRLAVFPFRSVSKSRLRRPRWRLAGGIMGYSGWLAASCCNFASKGGKHCQNGHKMVGFHPEAKDGLCSRYSSSLYKANSNWSSISSLLWFLHLRADNLRDSQSMRLGSCESRRHCKSPRPQISILS